MVELVGKLQKPQHEDQPVRLAGVMPANLLLCEHPPDEHDIDRTQTLGITQFS
ncbi:hypothetical protein D3C76_1795460 [compost metagenome]